MEVKNILLSVVVVSWNTKQQTTECISSFYSIDDYNFLKDRCELILIDNDSKDGTCDEIKKNYPQVILIENSENKGYAPACNQGMRTATGKYILLLGSDTVLKNDSLINCIEYLETHPECGAAGCRLLYPDGRLQGNCKTFPSLKNAFFTYLSLDRLNYNYDMLWFNYYKTIEADQIATTFLMIESALVRKINYFDESYRIMYNDVDLCKRIKDTGRKIIFIHTAEIYHHGSYSTRKADYKVRKQMYSDIFLYYRRNFHSKAYFLLPVLVLRFLIITVFK